jgi:uncharacterized protein (DUF1330 family)
MITIYKGISMCSYFVAQIKIHDWQEYELYLEGYDEIFNKYNGEVITVDDNPVILEGTWPYTRTVIIRFPSQAETMRWYESGEYQQLVKHRHKASKSDIIIVKGRK